jgi:TonB family protein
MFPFLQKNSPLTLVCILGFIFHSPVIAQTSRPAERVYTLVETMPRLAGTATMKDILPAIEQRLVYPPQAVHDNAEGKVFVSFTVATDGSVHTVAIPKGFRADCDSAVVRAVKKLPRFEPGQQAGKAVAVRFTIPVTFKMVNPRPATIHNSAYEH